MKRLLSKDSDLTSEWSDSYSELYIFSYICVDTGVSYLKTNYTLVKVIGVELQMKILVTGEAGFIGSNLCEALLNIGHKVVCFDNFSTGKAENITSMLKSSDFSLITGDIRSSKDCRKAVEQMMMHESPVINGDGEYSRGFTYIDNVIQANLKAIEANRQEAMNTVYNVAYGERTTLNQLVSYLKEYLSDFDPDIANIKVTHGDYREGDIPHSLASIDKAKKNIRI